MGAWPTAKWLEGYQARRPLHDGGTQGPRGELNQGTCSSVSLGFMVCGCYELHVRGFVRAARQLHVGGFVRQLQVRCFVRQLALLVQLPQAAESQLHVRVFVRAARQLHARGFVRHWHYLQLHVRFLSDRGHV